MRLIVSFNNGYDLVIGLRDTDFVRRWVDLLEKEISRTEILQQDTFSFLYTEERSREILLDAIKQVNVFLKREFITVPRDEDFDSANFYNELHEKFEQLAGPDYDHPTRLMAIGPDRIKDSIRLINRFCHRLERRPYQRETKMRVEFRSPHRLELLPEDYDLFENSARDNLILLDYSTLGKSLYECYLDGLPPDYPGMKLQKHYGPNFIVRFKSDSELQKEDFESWLKKHDYENIPPAALGAIILGEYEDLAAEEMIGEASQIINIKIERDNNG